MKAATARMPLNRVSRSQAPPGRPSGATSASTARRAPSFVEAHPPQAPRRSARRRPPSFLAPAPPAPPALRRLWRQPRQIVARFKVLDSTRF